jgi:hypothetical protein
VTTRRALTLLLAGASAAVALAGCGSSSPLGDASAHLSDIHSGVLDMRLLMNTKSSGDVGFTVSGPFDMPGGVARLTTVLHQGADTKQATVTAARGHGYVETGGSTYRLSSSDTAAVNATLGQAQGFSGLRLDQWISAPSVADAGTVDGVHADRITGPLNVSIALQDIITLQARAQGTNPPQLDQSSMQQLRNVATASHVQVISGHDDHLLRSLHADMDLVASLPVAARTALGDLGAVHIAFDVTLAKVNQGIAVQEPANALPAADLPSATKKATP